MPWLSWRTSPRRFIEDVRLFVNPRHWLTWPCSVISIAVYSKCVILLSKWVTLNAAPCIRQTDDSVVWWLTSDSLNTCVEAKNANVCHSVIMCAGNYCGQQHKMATWHSRYCSKVRSERRHKTIRINGGIVATRQRPSVATVNVCHSGIWPVMMLSSVAVTGRILTSRQPHRVASL